MWTGLRDLKTLDLKNNHITTVAWATFSGLSLLQFLYLGNNFLTEINGNMWIGLDSLNFLSLDGNRLQDIPRHGISHMPALTNLDLSSNKYLRTLRADIFNPDDYPDSNGFPARLGIHLSGNRFQCNTTLCWLIEGVESGTIYFVYSSPYCANHGGSQLSRVELNCIPDKTFCILQ